MSAQDADGTGAARIWWSAVAAVGTAGAALCVITFCRAMAVAVSAVEGPSDAVIASVPASLLSGAAFVILQRAAAARAGGFDILAALWVVMFGGTGAAFILRGRAAQGTGPALQIIGWSFAVMALVVLAAQLAAYVFIDTGRGPDALSSRSASGGPVYLALNLLGAVAGAGASLAIARALGF